MLVMMHYYCYFILFLGEAHLTPLLYNKLTPQVLALRSHHLVLSHYSFIHYLVVENYIYGRGALHDYCLSSNQHHLQHQGKTVMSCC
jgi:hypothetical protein